MEEACWEATVGDMAKGGRAVGVAHLTLWCGLENNEPVRSFHHFHGGVDGIGR